MFLSLGRGGSGGSGGSGGHHTGLPDPSWAVSAVGIEIDSALVALDDSVGDRETQTRSDTDPLRREKWIEDPRLDVIGNSGAVVLESLHRIDTCELDND